MYSGTEFVHLDYVASPVFVLEVADDARPLYAAFNACARQVAERPLSDFLGKTAVEVYGDAMGQVAYNRHCNVVKTGEPITYELELPFKTGPRHIRTTLCPVKDDAGNVKLIYGSSTDLSSEKLARETQVSLDTVTCEMEQFVTMAAHDLRTPMRNVTRLAEMLRDDFVDHGDGKIDLIDMLEEMAGKSLELIKDVLSHTRATTAHSPTTLFEFDGLCQDIFGVLDPQGLHSLSAPKVAVRTDKTVLQIIIRNLVENALKHGARASLTIQVDVRPLDGNQIEITVSDNGSGFDNPGIQFLDNGIFRVDSGYGLLGIRRLINARGGTIRAANRPDSDGSAVTFTLPGHWHEVPDAPFPHIIDASATRSHDCP